MLQKEIERLTAQLPLMEAVTRREFLKYRIREFNKAAADPQRLLTPDGGRLLREEKQRKEVWDSHCWTFRNAHVSQFTRELNKLSEQLTRDLTQYEKRYSEMFMYKSQHYLEIMGQDLAVSEKDADALARPLASSHRSATPRAKSATPH